MATEPAAAEVSAARRRRVLLIAEAANPEGISVPLVGWSLCAALCEQVDAHLVTLIRNQAPIERAGRADVPCTFIDSEAVARPAWRLTRLFGAGEQKAWTLATAISTLTYPYFEHLVWRRFGKAIAGKQFDLVHRVTPLSPTAPSLLAARCARAGVPFVLGPLNGGVPWPREFLREMRKEREGLSRFRAAYRLMPGHRSTLRDAAAILAGSRFTLSQIPAHHRAKSIYLPENAVDPGRFQRMRTGPGARPLRVVFLGRLVPYKGADMLLDAAAPLIQAGKVVVEVLGQGPEREHLESLVQAQGLQSGVTFQGWIPHAELQARLCEADVLGFPSIREFGGGVVLEAMMSGVIPIVMDYGGPAELVTPGTGVALEMGDRAHIVRDVRQTLARFCEDPGALASMRSAARSRVESWFTWRRKAEQVLEVYEWVLGARAQKPDFGCPLGTPVASAAQ